MPPKPKAKGGASEEDEAARKHKMKRIKEVLEQFLTEAQVPFDQNLLNKIYDSQGWPRPGGPEEPMATSKLVVEGAIASQPGESLEDEQSEEAKARAAAQVAETAASIKAAGKALKMVCPLHCVLNSVCYWRIAVCDEGLKGLVDFAMKVKPGMWEGLANLELQECQITAHGCDLLGERFAENIPLRSLVLDFNKIGDRGVALLAQGLRTNTNLGTLRLAYCGLTAKSGEELALGMIKGSRIKVLDVRGNQLGTHITSSGQVVRGSGLVPMLSGLVNEVLWRGADEAALQHEITHTHQAKQADPAQPASKGEAAPSMLRAAAGPWAGWDLFTTSTEEEKTLCVMTETLKKLDISDNCIVEDLHVQALTLACAAAEHDAFFTVVESAVQIGAAQITEGSYCQIEEEFVRVTGLRAAVTSLLGEDLDNVSNELPLTASEQTHFNVRAGSLLKIGKESVTVRAVRHGYVLVNRGAGGTEPLKHPARTKVTRSTELDVARATCFSSAAPHAAGATALRVSMMQHVVDRLQANASLTDLLMEHNSIGQDAAELFLEPTKRLQTFTVTGKTIQESLFKELYKDGTAKKGKKGKKKK